MKVLMLIISSDTEPIYAKHREIWRAYMRSHPDIECYFIQYKDDPQHLDGDTFWLTGKESFPGLIKKTIDSLEYFTSQKQYDFIVRTNLSSVWNFSALMMYLETLPKEGVYSGIIGNYGNFRFASGCGFIMTPDVVNMLIQHKHKVYSVNIIDDVDIGYVLTTLGVKITGGRRVDNSVYLEDAYHYRCKYRSNNDIELQNMRQLVNKIYNLNI